VSCCPTCGQRERVKGPRKVTSDDEHRRSIWRLIANYHNRVQVGGLPVLADMFALAELLGTAVNAAVAECRSECWKASWAEIGAASGMTRQGAERRWGSLGGVRRPGGQPASLR
jgi:hypothetical protein